MLSRDAYIRDAIQQKIARRVNLFRESKDRRPLEQDDELESIAREYTQTLATHDAYGHRVDGTKPWERASGHADVSENLHRESHYGVDVDGVAANTVCAWKHSPDHRDNMLRADAKLGGVGVCLSGDEIYVCHLLASRMTVRKNIGETLTRFF